MVVIRGSLGVHPGKCDTPLGGDGELLKACGLSRWEDGNSVEMGGSCDCHKNYRSVHVQLF